MAPKQKTFELIPDLPGLGQAQQQRPVDAAAAFQSRPPMTTKQAKKLYRQKSKGPKLSKAEQRRIDLMEQDRIRKEFEKEKAQARARIARDKKKAKEDKEKDEKKKKGLPLVQVHASQDTISRFISRLGFGGKNNTHLETVQEAGSESATEVESDSDVRKEEQYEERIGSHVQDHNKEAPGKENEDPADALGDSAARPAKRRKLEQPSRNLLDRMIHIPSQRSVGAVARAAREMERESWSRPSSIDADDPATETMLEDQLIADVELASSKSATKSSPNRQSPSRDTLPSHVQPPSHASLAPRVPSPPPPPPGRQPRPQPSRPQNFEVRQLPTANRVPSGGIPPTEQFRAKIRPVEDVFKRPASLFVPGGRQAPTMRRATAAKPSAPPRFKPPTGAAVPRSGGPKFLPRPARTASTPMPVQASPTYAGSRRPAIRPTDAFPSSTQLLVMNHVDELFPSPSQEARELHEDQQSAKTTKSLSGPISLLHKIPSVTDEPVNHQDRRPSAMGPPLPPRSQPGGNAPPDFAFLATQDLILSSQDIQELDTPNKVRTEPASRSLQTASHRNSLALLPEKSALLSDEKTRVVSGVQAPRDDTSAAASPSKEATAFDSGSLRPLPASESGHATCGRPLGHTVKEVTQCPTQALTRPRSKRIQDFSNGPSPSRPISQQNLTSPQKISGKHDVIRRAQPSEGSDCHPSSFHCPHSSAKHSQANSTSGGSCTAYGSQKGFAVPPASPAKKRMFGSSGPGAEVLVAMERSYKQNLAEERRRKEELRAQARKTSAEELAEQELAEIIEDDMLDDEIDSLAIQVGNPHGPPDDLARGDRHPATAKPGSPIGTGTSSGANATGREPETRAEPVASQETDYGDFDFEAEGELDMLADITWADDDLSDI